MKRWFFNKSFKRKKKSFKLFPFSGEKINRLGATSLKRTVSCLKKINNKIIVQKKKSIYLERRTENLHFSFLHVPVPTVILLHVILLPQSNLNLNTHNKTLHIQEKLINTYKCFWNYFFGVMVSAIRKEKNTHSWKVFPLVFLEIRWGLLRWLFRKALLGTELTCHICELMTIIITYFNYCY